jgi:hypothetical protein
VCSKFSWTSSWLGEDAEEEEEEEGVEERELVETGKAKVRRGQV